METQQNPITALEKLPMIKPVVDVMRQHLDGTLYKNSFSDEVTIEGMQFKIKTVPFKDIDVMYTSFDLGNFMESFKNIITTQLSDIHTKYEIYEMNAWNQCMSQNLDKFKNPANILYLRHYYFAKCLFLYLTCGK